MKYRRTVVTTGDGLANDFPFKVLERLRVFLVLKSLAPVENIHVGKIMLTHWL